jgi:hypothetical protein
MIGRQTSMESTTVRCALRKQIFVQRDFKANGGRDMMYVLIGHTESGDSLEPVIFREKPSNKRVEELLRDVYREEYEEVGFVHWDIHLAVVL